jgi:hypothetical protein
MEPKTLIVALSVFLALGAAAYFLYFLPGELPVSPERFAQGLASSGRVYIISDLRNASADTRQYIMQCGVDLAGSVALGAKNITFFVLDGNTCYRAEGNSSASSCLSRTYDGMVFRISQGTRTEYYLTHAEIGISDYSTPCSVGVKK